MRLSDGLRISGGEVIAFVGAGGKSTAIRRLVGELAGRIPTVVTTTTKIALDQSDLAQEHLILESIEDLLTAIESMQTFESILLTGGKDDKEPKWRGLHPDFVEEFIPAVRENGWVLLIEADGARGKSLKVPASYEPVLPSQCDLVVPVVGLDVIGEEVDSPKVHRFDLLMKLLDLGANERIRSDHIVKLLTSLHGGLKDIPQESVVRVLLNKADSDGARKIGREIAWDLLKHARIQSVLLASVTEDIPVGESFCRVGGVVLAAGASTRLEGLKQLMTFRNKPLVAYSVEAAIGGGLDPILVVVGRDADDVRNALSHYPVQFVENAEWESGQSGSVRLGLNAVHDQVEAVIFLLADMPLVTSDLVEALVKKHRQTLGSVIAPFVEGKRGNPVLFDRKTFDALREVKGDQGGRALFSQYPMEQIEWDKSALFDVDSDEELRRMRDIE